MANKSDRYHYYTNEVNGMEAVRTLQYSVPEKVKNYVRMIQPTIRFGQFNPQRSTAFRINEGQPLVLANVKVGTQFHPTYPSPALNATFCNTTITPDCLRDLYSVPRNLKANPNNGNRLGIAGYLEEWAKYDDLEQFLKTYTNQDPKKNNFTVALINGGRNDQTDGAEDDVEANRKCCIIRSL